MTMEYAIGDRVTINTVNGKRDGVVETIREGIVRVRLDIGKRTLIFPKIEPEETSLQDNHEE